MLPKSDLLINLRQIHLLSLLGILPVTVKGGRLYASKSYKSLSVCVFYMILVQSHIFFPAFLTVDRFNKGWREALPTLSLDYVFSVGFQLSLLTGFVNFILHPDEVCGIFNGCMIDESNLVATKASFLPCFKSSFIDLITRFLPILFDIFVVPFSITLVITRTLPALYGAHLIFKFLAVGIDIVVAVCVTEWMYFGILLQMLFIEKASYVLQRESLTAKDAVVSSRSNERKVRSIRLSCAAMSTLRTELNIFNECQARIVCGFRAVVTSGMVVCGLTVMEFFHLHPISGSFNGMCVIYGSLLYVTMYNSGFQLPRRCEAWKRLHLRQVGLLKCSYANRFSLNVLRRKIRSVCTRVVGVRVGGFYYLKRESTPSFIDFNIKYIVRLMVAFRRR